jgi:hypothetical protein
MTYVPTPIHETRASPQAQELAHRIEHAIREYRQSHPGMGETEVYQAVRLAAARTGTGAGHVQAMRAALIGLTVLLLLGSLLLWRMA